MSDDDHQGDAAEIAIRIANSAVDPLEVAKRHCRGLLNALTAVDLANGEAWVVTGRMRAAVDVLMYDLSELRHFMPKRHDG